MSQPMGEKLIALLGQPGYQPLKLKAIARKLGISSAEYPRFRDTVKDLIRRSRIELASGHVLQLPSRRGRIIGVFRSIRGGGGFVRPKPGQGVDVGDVFIKAPRAGDAASGDVVLVAILRQPRAPGRAPEGEILDVVERASDRFVGTYRQDRDEGFVRVDGHVFREDIYVGDAGAKGARTGDKVVFEMLRFPSSEMAGEGVVVEVLGPRGKPGIDLLSVVRQFHLPDSFTPDALAEAREAARLFDDSVIASNRLDLTAATTVTIDPEDAKDFDDAVSVEVDDKGFWRLGVHIADVSWFVRSGGALDRESRERGTSVYLPGKVLPMLPELISNGLASLQEGKLRYTKSVFIEIDSEGRITHTEMFSSAIKVAKRLTYGQVMSLFAEPQKLTIRISAKVRSLLDRMRQLASLLRQRRRARGFLELWMRECELEYDSDGRIAGAHYSADDESHQMIEEFMLTANEAVAAEFQRREISILRRVHENPDPHKLKAFAEFVATLDVPLKDFRSRFELQRVLASVAGKATQHAVHYALLRSLKIASYGPQQEGHWALASDAYCHFTSPIRRYPDLTVHRMLDKLLSTGKAGADYSELVALGEHCSFTERRAEMAERELIKIKLLEYLSHRIGMEMDMIVTGVEEFGFFAQGVEFPAEGLVHVRTMVDDFYKYDASAHSLVGRRKGRRFRLGDKVRCVVWKVDQEQRELDLRIAEPERATESRPKSRKARR